jgi:hypothetical protein
VILLSIGAFISSGTATHRRPLSTCKNFKSIPPSLEHHQSSASPSIRNIRLSLQYSIALDIDIAIDIQNPILHALPVPGSSTYWYLGQAASVWALVRDTRAERRPTTTFAKHTYPSTPLFSSTITAHDLSAIITRTPAILSTCALRAGICFLQTSDFVVPVQQPMSTAVLEQTPDRMEHGQVER